MVIEFSAEIAHTVDTSHAFHAPPHLHKQVSKQALY